jgi:hypothetical protein
MNTRRILHRTRHRPTMPNMLHLGRRNRLRKVIIARNPDPRKVRLHRLGRHEREPEVDAVLGELVGERAGNHWVGMDVDVLVFGREGWMGWGAYVCRACRRSLGWRCRAWHRRSPSM